MSFQPFHAPADPDNGVRLPISEHEQNHHSMAWSFGCAMVSLVAAYAMVVLVEGHEPGGSMRVADSFPFEKVVPTVGASAIAISLAILFSVPVLLRGNLTPLLWLFPVCLALLWFVNTYDWCELVGYGKAAPSMLWRCLHPCWLHSPIGFARAVLLFVGLTLGAKWLQRAESNHEAIAEAEFQRLLAEEISLLSASR